MKIRNASNTTLSEPKWDWGVEESSLPGNREFLMSLLMVGSLLAGAGLAILSITLSGGPMRMSASAFLISISFIALGLIVATKTINKVDAELDVLHKSDLVETLKRQEHWIANVLTPYLKEHYNLDLVDLDYQDSTARVNRNGEEIQVRFEGIEFTPNTKFDGVGGVITDGLYHVKIASSGINVKQVIHRTIEEE